MSADAACVFCKIRDGEIPSMRVYEDDRTLAFMDINPLNAGHCLVITKTHAPTIWESDPADLQAAITAAQKVALGLRDGGEARRAEHAAGQRRRPPSSRCRTTTCT